MAAEMQWYDFAQVSVPLFPIVLLDLTFQLAIGGGTVVTSSDDREFRLDLRARDENFFLRRETSIEH